MCLSASESGYSSEYALANRLAFESAYRLACLSVKQSELLLV